MTHSIYSITQCEIFYFAPRLTGSKSNGGGGDPTTNTMVTSAATRINNGHNIDAVEMAEMSKKKALAQTQSFA